jgi:ATP phosphoribosyltransferase regulatory subunit HisZ
MDAFAQVERAVAGSRHVDATVDFGDLRGFDYYTGIRFAGYAAGAPDAILRGGRYDELIGRYGRDARAIGFAIDLEAVAQAQRAAGIAAPVPATGVVVGDAAIAEVLRQHGLRSVVQAEVQGSWGAWLRGAGFDAAVVGDRMIRADDSERSARAEIQAARAGDIAPLIALIKA